MLGPRPGVELGSQICEFEPRPSDDAVGFFMYWSYLEICANLGRVPLVGMVSLRLQPPSSPPEKVAGAGPGYLGTDCLV